MSDLATMNQYLKRLMLTQDVAGAMVSLMRELGLPVSVENPQDVLSTEYAAGVFEALCSVSRFNCDDVVPRIPSMTEAGYPQSIPVIWNVDAAKRLRALLAEAEKKKDSIDVNNGIEGFNRSITTFFDVHINGDAAGAFEKGARMLLLPTAIDWGDTEGSGDFAEYLTIPRFVVTHHTQQQIYATQLMGAIARLMPESADEELVLQMRFVKTLLEDVVADLGVYFFDQFSIAKLHTERIQNALFDKARNYRVHVARFSINMADMNSLDDTGAFGSFVLDTMKKWLQSRKGIMRSAVQSSEKTTFQFIVEHPEDAEKVFENIDRDFQTALNREFRRRYKGNGGMDEKARMILANINRFRVRGTVAVLPFDSSNVVGFAVQQPEDVKIFYDLLTQTDIDRRVLAEIRGRNFLEESFILLKPFLSRIGLDMPRMKAWVSDNGITEEERVSRKQMLQAFILQAIYYGLRHLSGVLDYFEKEMVSDRTVPVYGIADLPTMESDFEGHARLQAYLERTKYVSDGTFNPALDRPELLDTQYVSHLPHLRALSEDFQRSHRGDERSYIARVLSIWDRLSHEWGYLTHSPRENNPGGAKDVFFAAMAGLEKAVEDGRTEDVPAALEEVKRAGREFLRILNKTWAKSLHDPRNPFILKRDMVGEDADGNVVNTNVFAQELARLGWTDAFAAEADSIQQFLKSFSDRFSPDFRDEAFQSVWSTILEVAREWQMKVPLIYQPAGDFVVIVTPPADIHGNAIDSSAFTYEVWARILREYGGMPYSDVKKVKMRDVRVEIDGAHSKEDLERAMLSVADKLNLQTVPYIVRENGGNRYALLVPCKNGWDGDADVDPGAVIRELGEAGIAIGRYTIDEQVVSKRIGIYQRKTDGNVSYRFSAFNPKGGWKKFRKTLTITTVNGRFPRLDGRPGYDRAFKIQDEMATAVDAEKNKNFPYKAGFGVHESVRVTAENMESTIGNQRKRFEQLAAFVDSSVLSHVEKELPADRGRMPKNIAGAVYDLTLRINSFWFQELAMVISRLKAENESLKMTLKASGFSNQALRRKDVRGVISRRHDAVRILEDMTYSMEMVRELMNAMIESGRRDLSAAEQRKFSMVVRTMRECINRFRELDYDGGASGAAPSGASGSAKCGSSCAARRPRLRGQSRFDAAEARLRGQSRFDAAEARARGPAMPAQAPIAGTPVGRMNPFASMRTYGAGRDMSSLSHQAARQTNIPNSFAVWGGSPLANGGAQFVGAARPIAPTAGVSTMPFLGFSGNLMPLLPMGR